MNPNRRVVVPVPESNNDDDDPIVRKEILPSIESFQLNNILRSIQDDSIEQLIQSIFTVSGNYNNDLNAELIESIDFQDTKIINTMDKIIKHVKFSKNLKNSPNCKNIDHDLYTKIQETSRKTKDLIEKLNRLEGLLPVKERLFEEVNSHKLHYPRLYKVGRELGAGAGQNQGEAAVAVAVAEQDQHSGQAAVMALEEEQQNQDVEADSGADSDAVQEAIIYDPDPVETDLQRIYHSRTGTFSSDKSSKVSRQVVATSGADDDATATGAMASAKANATAKAKDERIAMLSKNIDDIISERAQQQQLQSMSSKPSSIIFPTALKKRTSSAASEDAKAIIIPISRTDRQEVLFGLRKFL